MSYARIGDAVTTLFKAMTVMLIILGPLGLWKLVEVSIWFFSRVRWVKP